MAKRLTDTTKWSKAWFRSLPPTMKCFWMYLVDNCNVAGIWDVDWGLAKYMIGSEVSRPMVEKYLSNQIVFLDKDHLLVVKFIPFQYGWPFLEKNNMYETVCKLLQKRGITLESVSVLLNEDIKPLGSPSEAPPKEDVSSSEGGMVKDKVKIKKEDSKEETKEETQFKNYISKHYPRLFQMKDPITFEQTARLIKQYGRPIVEEVFEEMQNYQQLFQRYLSANLTARKWIRIRQDSATSVKQDKHKVITKESITNEYSGRKSV